jgi:hypothetical protein
VTGGEAGSPPPAEPLLGTASESADLIQADSGPGNYRTKHAAAVFLSRQSGLVTREQYVFRVVWTATFARVWRSTARLFIYLVCHAGRVSIRFPPHWLRRTSACLRIEDRCCQNVHVHVGFVPAGLARCYKRADAGACCPRSWAARASRVLPSAPTAPTAPGRAVAAQVENLGGSRALAWLRCVVICLAQSMGATGMPIRAYLPTSGASFSPESLTNMGAALDGAVDILGIEPRDETKREAVARFIIKLAEIDGAWMRRACAIRPLWL